MPVIPTCDHLEHTVCSKKHIRNCGIHCSTRTKWIIFQLTSLKGNHLIFIIHIISNIVKSCIGKCCVCIQTKNATPLHYNAEISPTRPTFHSNREQLVILTMKLLKSIWIKSPFQWCITGDDTICTFYRNIEQSNFKRFVCITLECSYSIFLFQILVAHKLYIKIYSNCAWERAIFCTNVQSVTGWWELETSGF